MSVNSLALAVIARDESRCIERCLRSIGPWVDRVIVLDTGSRDSTVDLSRALGAQVHGFAWVDDFAAARNRALELADADWCVMLDADEWMVHGAQALQALRGAAPVFAGQIRVDSEFDCDDGVGIAPSWMARVAPRGARYEGRVHEQLAPAMQRRRLEVHCGHDGYRRERRAAKSGRNERLLRLDLQERPGDPYLNYQLGKEHETSGRFELALPFYETAYQGGAPADSWRHDLILRLMFTLKRTARFAQASALAQSQSTAWADSPDFHFVLGDVLLDWAIAQPALAAQLLPAIESAWTRSLALGERPDLEGAVRGRGSYLAAKNLAAFHTSLGRAARAVEFQRLESSMRDTVAP